MRLLFRNLSPAVQRIITSPPRISKQCPTDLLSLTRVTGPAFGTKVAAMWLVDVRLPVPYTVAVMLPADGTLESFDPVGLAQHATGLAFLAILCVRRSPRTVDVRAFPRFPATRAPKITVDPL
jgi:hypothetical protein